MKSVAVSYDGAEVYTAQHLETEGIRAGLPPVECSGQVSILNVTEGVVREGLSDPESLLLPESEWPPTMPRATVWANDEVFGEVAGVLTERSVGLTLKSRR